MKVKFASKGLTAGQLDSIVEKLGGYDSALRFLRGETIVSEPNSWFKEDGVIYFSVTSDGETGLRWVANLGVFEGYDVSTETEKILLSSHFKPTSNATTRIAVLTTDIFSNPRPSVEEIHAIAIARNLRRPNIETACLIRKKFSNKDLQAMGLRCIVVMHNQVSLESHKSSAGMLGVRILHPGLHTYTTMTGGFGYPDYGYAFVV